MCFEIKKYASRLVNGQVKLIKGVNGLYSAISVPKTTIGPLKLHKLIPHGFE